MSACLLVPATAIFCETVKLKLTNHILVTVAFTLEGVHIENGQNQPEHLSRRASGDILQDTPYGSIGVCAPFRARIFSEEVI